MVKMRLSLILLICLAWAAGAGCSSHNRIAEGDVRQQIAQWYGIDGFDQVEAIRFTFNAQVGTKKVHRAWLWRPVTGEVILGADSPAARVTFTHPLPAETADDRQRALDAKFVNDRYWLLFPLHLIWDQAAAVEDRGLARRPMGGGEARRIEVRYPDAGGYTPGDVYELFIDTRGEMVEWVYRRGGDASPTRLSTWEDHHRLGPLRISLDHRGPEGFRVWFSDVAIKIHNRPGWVYPAD